MSTRTKAPTILLIVIVLLATFALPAGAQSGLSGKLTVAGSSALLPMMQEAATQFQKANPGVQITVTGGGSGAGRKQVCAGQIDIGDSDVRLTGKEKKDLNCGSAVETPVAIQAFAPVANKTGPGSVASLSRKQLQDIFTGKITNWKDVGGDNQPIVLINRAKGSGTRAVMARYLFDGPDKFAVGASEEDNSQTVLQTVAQTPGAISYLGFAYLDDPSIKALQIDGVAPTRDDIMNGKWPIVGIGYSITKGQPNALANAFLNAQFSLVPGRLTLLLNGGGSRTVLPTGTTLNASTAEGTLGLTLDPYLRNLARGSLGLKARYTRNPAFAGIVEDNRLFLLLNLAY